MNIDRKFLNQTVAYRKNTDQEKNGLYPRNAKVLEHMQNNQCHIPHK